MPEIHGLVARFDAVERVIADPLRFKLRLGIGEDAYRSMKLAKKLQQLWDVGGVAASGAGVVASPAVAATFFASTASGGLLSMIGLGTAAATPVGWIVAAAVVSGGAYYGVTRLFRDYAGSRVHAIPRFINTPIDLLGANLFDLMGSLAVKVARIDGTLSESERDAITGHFITEWGFEPAYLESALGVLIAEADRQSLKEMARTLAAFQRANPDCNPAAMRGDLIAFLREVAAADGILDEREELAIEAADAILREENALISQGRKTLAAWSASLGERLHSLSGRIRRARS